MKQKRQKSVQEYIIEALFTLMEQYDYQEISITDITNTAGVGRASFYRNFTSKEDIIHKWIDAVTFSFLNRSSLSYENDSPEDYFFKLFTHLDTYKKETMLIYKANLMYLLQEEFEQVFLNSNKDKYNDYKSYFLIGGIFNVYVYWIKNNFKETPRELSIKLLDILEK